MKIILVCILKLTLVSFASTDDSSGSVPPVICAFAGIAANDKNYKFDVTKIPDRCKTLQYGAFYMDKPPSNQDAADIAKAVEKNISIYVFVSFSSDCLFSTIFDPNNGSASYEKYITPMLKYVNENKITGVVFDCLDIFDSNITDYPKKLHDLILNQIKKESPDLKIGITLPAEIYGAFIDNSFDFTHTNDVVDFYSIDTYYAGVSCRKEALTTGVLPITTDQNDVAALEGICNAVQKSKMNKNKVVITLPVTVQVLKSDGSNELLSYTQYCNIRNATDPSAVYCPDTIDRFYAAGDYVKKYFKGIILFDLANDDFSGSCNCNLTFPVTNTYIDGFLSVQNKPCAALA